MRNIEYERLMEISIALTAEKDEAKLLNRILRECMDLTDCDGGTLYICVPEGLRFEIMITKSMDYYRGAGFDEPVQLPPVALTRQNVCTCCAMDRKLINIPDIYLSEEYDFSGARRYDEMTGYHSHSMLVVPMLNDRSEVIGVLQLLNARDEAGENTAFRQESEKLIASLASLAAISLTNANYAKAIVETLDSFVEVMVDAVDARSHYNANHTRNMVKYGQRFLDWLDRNTDWKFSGEERRQLLMSIWLHDVGKLVIPLEVMDKATRLGPALEGLRHRFREMQLLAKIDLLEGRTRQETWEGLSRELEEGLQLVETANTVGYMPDDMLEAVEALGRKRFPVDGVPQAWLTEEELHALRVRKGTLTQEERSIMESHASMTGRMLEKMKFTGEYAMVPKWAAQHHEYPNGKGYPQHLAGDEVSREVRLITILDVFDALTARDRPYKKPMPDEKALSILEDMAKYGEVDGELLALFRQSKAWENSETEETK